MAPSNTPSIWLISVGGHASRSHLSSYNECVAHYRSPFIEVICLTRVSVFIEHNKVDFTSH